MKKLLRTCVALFICIVISDGIGVQAYAQTPPVNSNTESFWPQADIIEWRYKIEGGKLYKRQYNCTRDQWIGNWILVS